MNHILRTVFAGIFLIVFACQVSAQSYSLPSDGKDFYLGFVNPSYNKVANQVTEAFFFAAALVSTYEDNHVTVSYFDKQTGVETFSRRFFIPERTGVQISLDLSQMTPNDTGDIPEFCACHISADRPINVEFFSYGACAGGSYLPIQTAALGKKYVIASYQNNPGTLGILCDNGPSSIEDSRGFFEIIAPYDGTQVTITPNSTTMGGHTGFSSGKGAIGVEMPYTVSLRRGQTYFVKSASSNSTDDISNSIITSDKPIAVIAGHENAAIGGGSGTLLEGRNYMVQQMYPNEVWDTTGYVMIPLKDSQPADPLKYDGVGENYRFFSSEKPGSQINFYDACIGQYNSMSASRLQSPPNERNGVTCPVDVEGKNGIPFTVMLYDQRNVALSAPFPAPSMINIIPISKWRTSYLWYVPANEFESLQGYFINVIGQTDDFIGSNGIQASFNGGPIKPIKNVLGVNGTYKNIPNHPELTGIKLVVYPGSYFARGPHPFMIYNYGFRGLDPEMDLGDLDCDDYFFSYGLPAGLQIGSGIPHISVKVDTTCSYWNVCVHDSTFGMANQGIKTVYLLDDSHQNFIQSNPPKSYYNSRLDDSLDPFMRREIDFTGDDSDVCFNVLIDKPIDSAYAPLFISDDQGNAIIVDLYYHPPLVKLAPDSGRYLLAGLRNDTCTRFVFTNLSAAGKSFTFTSANLKVNNPNFSVSNITPPLPATIKHGDSLIITVCFNAKDTVLQRDTIQLVNDCFSEPIDLAASGSTPLIVADDHDFGSVIVDSTRCAPVGIKNVGTASLILTKQWLMDRYGRNFTFPDSTLLPIILKPQQKITLDFCFTPHTEEVDTTVQHWGTNLITPYAHSIKDTSVLIGRGVKAGFAWDRTQQVFVADSAIVPDSVIEKIFLYNNATDRLNGPTVHVDQVSISGPDAAEFSIVSDQIAKMPLSNFNLFAGDSIWVAVMFKPDLAKPYPARYADRHANLVASSSSEADQIVKLIGTWAKDGVIAIAPKQSFTIRPNPASGNSVIVFFASPQETKATLSLYDLLGREVYRSEILQNDSEAEIPLSNLNPGTYYVRLSSGVSALTQKLEVLR